MKLRRLLLALVASLLSIGSAYVGAPVALARAQASTVVNYYESPCVNRARVTRDIPPLTVDQSKGLIAWERRRADTPEAANYHAAVRACNASRPIARWDWSSMVLARTETVR